MRSHFTLHTYVNLRSKSDTTYLASTKLEFYRLLSYHDVINHLDKNKIAVSIQARSNFANFTDRRGHPVHPRDTVILFPNLSLQLCKLMGTRFKLYCNNRHNQV